MFRFIIFNIRKNIYHIILHILLVCIARKFKGGIFFETWDALEKCNDALKKNHVSPNSIQICSYFCNCDNLIDNDYLL